MQDELKQLDQVVLATLGQPVQVVRPGEAVITTQAIISREVVATGSFEAVMEQLSVITLASDVVLNRGDRVEAEGQTWRVDRKLKDDGQFVTWNLHEQ